MMTRFVRLVWGTLIIGVAVGGGMLSLPGCSPMGTGEAGSSAGVGVVSSKHSGQQIVVCGQRIDVGTPVVLWDDPGTPGGEMSKVQGPKSKVVEGIPGVPGGMNAYAGQPQLPINYGSRRDVGQKELPPDVDRVVLASLVDQLVIHYDGSGTSRRCFTTLTSRNLSAHFLIDVDGTIYQTLDLKERAFHATVANDRSIGVELANVGAYPQDQEGRLAWYQPDGSGGVRLVPPWPGEDWRTRGYAARPIRPQLIEGWIQGQWLRQYDFTARQYEALAKLTAGLCRVFPKLVCDYPRDSEGQLVREQLPTARWESYRGLLGHYHIQANKVDPGPAFDWDRLINDARQYLGQE